MRAVRLLLVLAVVASACSEGGDDGPQTPTQVAESPAEVTAASPIAQRTRTYVTVDGQEGEEVVTPRDLLAAVRFGVEDGAWTEAAGIARALAGVVGRETPVPGLRLADVGTPGLTALIRTATDLLDTGDVPADVAEDLEASLAFFSPSQEILDRISQPASDDASTALAVHRLGSANTRARPVQTGSCRDVATKGFQPDLDTGEACYAQELEIVDGHALRVYYPRAWQDDAARMEVVGATMEALVKTQKTFTGQLEVGAVNVVFSLSPSEDETAEEAVPAATGRFLDSAACPITLYASGASLNLDQHRQSIAHEAFHCLQDRNFTTAPFGTHAWWLEGSAEFFSNVVYEDVNLEHRQVPAFDGESITKAPTAMWYENAVFFQYYANRRGQDGVLELMEKISSGGAGLATLTSVAGMDELWQEFVVAFMAGQVLDTNGSALPAGEEVTSKTRVASVGPVAFSPSPLVASRYRVEYAQEKRFVQTASSGLPHAVVEWESRHDPTAWTELPGEVRSKCDDDAPYLLVVTATENAATFTASVDAVEDAACDPCVLGPWEMQLATFQAYMVNLFASLGQDAEDFTFVIDGHYYLEFDAERNVRAIRQPLSVTVQGQGHTLPTTDITGTDIGQYDADGEHLSIQGLSGGGEASLGGVTVGFTTDPQSRGAPYTCDEDLLTIEMPDFGPISFDRITEIPDPASVEVESGSPGS